MTTATSRGLKGSKGSERGGSDSAASSKSSARADDAKSKGKGGSKSFSSSKGSRASAKKAKAKSVKKKSVKKSKAAKLRKSKKKEETASSKASDDAPVPATAWPTSAPSPSLDESDLPTPAPIAEGPTFVSNPAPCGVQDFQGQCTTTTQCQSIYEDAFDCKNSEGGVCFCLDDQVCGCLNGSEPTTPASGPEGSTFAPVPASCGVQDFQGECTTTTGCQSLYDTAFDCKNSEGGVCFCLDNQVCGCLDESDQASSPTLSPAWAVAPSPTECGVQDFQGECTTTIGCQSLYSDAFDCNNGLGGVCFCPDNQICGCLDGSDST